MNKWINLTKNISIQVLYVIERQVASLPATFCPIQRTRTISLFKRRQSTTTKTEKIRCVILIDAVRALLQLNLFYPTYFNASRCMHTMYVRVNI